jgi:chromosome segregation ATPase
MAFADQVASGALTSQLISERKQLEGRIQRLRTQHTEAIRDKSTVENKSWNLLDKVTALEKEKEDLGRRLNDEKEDAENAHAEAQAAHKRVADLELEVKNIGGYREKMESATRARVDRAHMLFVDVYHDLGAQTAAFDKSGEEVGPASWGGYMTS